MSKLMPTAALFAAFASACEPGPCTTHIVDGEVIVVCPGDPTATSYGDASSSGDTGNSSGGDVACEAGLGQPWGPCVDGKCVTINDTVLFCITGDAGSACFPACADGQCPQVTGCDGTCDVAGACMLACEADADCPQAGMVCDLSLPTHACVWP